MKNNIYIGDTIINSNGEALLVINIENGVVTLKIKLTGEVIMFSEKFVIRQLNKFIRGKWYVVEEI